VALATLDRRPPSLFRQGPTALSKLLLCAGMAIVLMVADARFGLTPPLRSLLASALLPVQRVLLTPVDAWEGLQDRLRGAESAMAAEARARKQLAAQALVLARTQTLSAENEQLRRLLALRDSLPVATVSAEVLYEQADAFARRVVLDRGRTDSLAPGAPVIDERGVLGLLRRVHLNSSELVLLADRESTIPVRNSRTGALHVAYGGERRFGLELRFVAANADIKEGDVLRTSGLDGVYPAGLPVARVAEVERRGQTSFARVLAQPYAVADRARQVLVLKPSTRVSDAQTEAAAAPAPAALKADRRERAEASKRPGRAP
jgi:rod shape-determining protein MreC